MRCPIYAIICVTLFFAPILQAADDSPEVQSGHGIVEKIEKDVLTIKHRSTDGKFDKNLVLKLTGTSRLSLLSTQKRAEKIVLVQKDIEARQLTEKQQITVIYATNDKDHVLLAAVVQSN